MVQCGDTTLSVVESSNCLSEDVLDKVKAKMGQA